VVNKIKHSFKALDKVKFMGNKGIVVQVSIDNIVVSLVGPFIFGTKTFKSGTTEFMQLKKA
jgi:hypothetical protein